MKKNDCLWIMWSTSPCLTLALCQQKSAEYDESANKNKLALSICSYYILSG